MTADKTAPTHRVIVTGPDLAAEAQDLLASHGCQVSYVFGKNGEELNSLAERVSADQTEAIIVRKGQIDRAVLSASASLRAVSKHGVGVDNIDLQAAAELGIAVMNTPAANFASVAEHTLALMFSLSRRIPQQDAGIRQGKWDKRDYRGQELGGKTLGLIGFGRIGRRVAELVTPLQMETLVYDPMVLRRESAGVNFVDELPQLLRRADIVSLHCPLTSETRGLIGEQQLRQMKRTAWIVNTARGAVIDEGALIAALRQSQIAGAALDTFEAEPPSPDNPLFAFDNVVLTNHIAGISLASARNMGVEAARNVLAVLEHGRPDSSSVLVPARSG